MPNTVNTVEQHSEKTAIFVCGPTAVGKTEVAVRLAEWLQTEILSFDSRQFFRELKIGAAPPDDTDLRRVNHHFVGHLSVAENYNAGDFEKEALSLLDHIFKDHRYAILVGGSGLYMQALTHGFDDMPEILPGIREQLNQHWRQAGIETLQKELLEKDPQYYSKTDPQNPQRLIRALEVIRSTGKTYSSYRKKKKANRPFHILKIGLTMPREELYSRIDRRVDDMLEKGLKEEVKSLRPYQDHNALQTVGYRELFQYLEGDIPLEKAVEEIKKNSRRYAKRQITWFRKDPDIRWFHPGDMDPIKKFILSV